MLYFCNHFIFFVNIVLSSRAIANFYTTDDREPFPKSFVGSNLFGDGKFVKKCFSMEDVALLSARSKFEALIPSFTISTNDLENDKSVEQTLEYLQGISGLVKAINDDNVQYITQAAYYDVVGGYLHFYYLPFVKFSFYAGTLTYKNTLKVYNFQNNCKQILNTHGNGWRLSTFKFLKMKYKIQPINNHTHGVQSESTDIFKDPCGNLLLTSNEDYTSDYSDRELIVSLPRIESVDNDNIISVWLPFKHKRNFILNSKSSAFVLTRYYVDVLKCYQFRNVMSNPFNRRFRKLLHEKVIPLIHNDEFYPGFGAILRVWETLKSSSIVVRSTFKDDMDSDANELWDETVNLAEDADTNLLNKGWGQSQEVQAVNETNFFVKMVDSIRNFENEWNQKQKIKYICLAFVVAVIGLLIIILCIFISRERRKANINRSTLTRERENNWKVLLRKLSKKSNRNGPEDTNSEPDLRYSKYEDTTSLASDTFSTKQTPVCLKATTSQIKSTDNRNISNARHKKVKYKTVCNEDYSSSSSSSMSYSTKSKKRRIYRKIRDEMKQSPYGDQIERRPRSIYSTLEFMPSRLNDNCYSKFKKEAAEISLRKTTCTRQSSDSEKEINSSGWETLSSSKVIPNVSKYTVCYYGFDVQRLTKECRVDKLRKNEFKSPRNT